MTACPDHSVGDNEDLTGRTQMVPIIKQAMGELDARATFSACVIPPLPAASVNARVTVHRAILGSQSVMSHTATAHMQ